MLQGARVARGGAGEASRARLLHGQHRHQPHQPQPPALQAFAEESRVAGYSPLRPQAFLGDALDGVGVVGEVQKNPRPLVQKPLSTPTVTSLQATSGNTSGASGRVWVEPRRNPMGGEKLAIDRTTMVGLVDELEGRRLVERRRDLEDRRRYALALRTPTNGRSQKLRPWPRDSRMPCWRRSMPPSAVSCTRSSRGYSGTSTKTPAFGKLAAKLGGPRRFYSRRGKGQPVRNVTPTGVE